MLHAVDAYILQCPSEIQGKLFELERVIREAVPEATARIAWSMPTYTIGKTNVIHFSAQKTFISLHIGTEAMYAFEDRLRQYSNTKSTVHFGFKDELPVELIQEIIAHNVAHICT